MNEFAYNINRIIQLEMCSKYRSCCWYCERQLLQATDLYISRRYSYIPQYDIATYPTFQSLVSGLAHWLTRYGILTAFLSIWD